MHEAGEDHLRYADPAGWSSLAERMTLVWAGAAVPPVFGRSSRSPGVGSAQTARVQYPTSRGTGGRSREVRGNAARARSSSPTASKPRAAGGPTRKIGAHPDRHRIGHQLGGAPGHRTTPLPERGPATTGTTPPGQQGTVGESGGPPHHPTSLPFRHTRTDHGRRPDPPRDAYSAFKYVVPEGTRSSIPRTSRILGGRSDLPRRGCVDDGMENPPTAPPTATP